MKWKGRNAQRAAITLAFVALALFLIPRLFPPKKGAHPPVRKKTAAQANKNFQAPAVPPVRMPLPAPAPLPPPRPLRAGAPKIVFVIDDIGHSIESLDSFRRLGNRVTYAILPFLKYSVYFDRLSAETGAEIILHMPLESVKDTIPGPGLIRTNMSNDYVLDILDRELNLLPHCVGVNNHMGSKGTADPWLMELILKRLKQRNMIFMDSMTTAQSVARQVGSMIGLPVLKRDIFLDNDDSPEAIRGQVRLLAGIARKRGYAIGIGHYHANTIKVLSEEIPRLEKEGFQMIALRDILRLRKS